jgi:uncharacterized heparinase superfamily protein
MVQSLRPQLRLVRRSVEHDIGGNHVLRNGAALVIGGLCLHDARSAQRGLALLEREVRRQLLDDGGHEERSPSYHRAVLADLEDVASVIRNAGRPVPDWLADATAAMRRWLGALAGPDGRLPLLNDGWEGPPIADRSSAPLSDMSSSGYVVLRSEADQAVLDVGVVAPPHLPPHAHADVLSFVMWADGHPVVVDPGSFSYAGPDRQRYRGTAAHNTVEVDGEDQCEFWGAFRAAHMPAVRRGSPELRAEAVLLSAEHDGYSRLSDPVIHRRTFCWLQGNGLVVVDRLMAGGPHDVRSRIHLAPGVDWDGERAGPLRISALGEGPAPKQEAGHYSPHLGRELPASVLTQTWRVQPGSLFGWALVRPGVEVRLTDERLTIRMRGAHAFEVALPPALLSSGGDGAGVRSRRRRRVRGH